MILLCGIPSEEPLARVAAALTDRSARFAIFNQRAFADAAFSFRVGGDAVTGELRLGGASLPLASIDAAYTRLMDDRLLPELHGEQPDSERCRDCRSLHEAIIHWLEFAPVRVVNRASAMATNSSKPYQAQLISACGFEVPESLVTNVPDLALDFRRRHNRVVYKSTSSIRSIVRELDDDALWRLEHIRWCPVHFQAYVEGVDWRVHVVGEEVYATRVTSTGIDYRYAATHDGGDVALEAATLPDELEAACVVLTRTLGLEFSGIDLRLTNDGRPVCFEVNPCPAFNYYERRTGQPIAAAVARHLCEAEG
jgi:glutathione synthase/RimK-type ligase-like ATP-grasp enzyme